MRKNNIRGVILSWHVSVVVVTSILLMILSLGTRPTVGFPLKNQLKLISNYYPSRSSTPSNAYHDSVNAKSSLSSSSSSSSSSSRRGIVALSDKLLPTSDSSPRRRRSARRRRTKALSIRNDRNKKQNAATTTSTRRVVPGKSQSSSSRRDQREQQLTKDSYPIILSNNNYQTRRKMLGFSSILSMALASLLEPESTNAAGLNNIFLNGGRGKSSLYVVNTREEINDQVRTEPVDTPVQSLSSEYALLEVLPVKNKIFRTLESKIESLSDLIVINETTKNDTWIAAQKASENALETLVQKQGKLEPVYNPEDSTELAIEKATRGEVLIDELRNELEEIVNATYAYNATRTFVQQKKALLALSYLGELLVKEFPYIVPSKGKFSYLPRLLGRAKVTFRMKRGNSILGNITIIADGYAAPITAGNFVDLSIRNFYTGLPIKAMPKKFGPQAGPTSAQQLATINVMGSYNEGFYDPLTAKLRRIPLEIIRLEVGTRRPKLSYSARDLSDTSISDKSGDANLLPSLQGKPLLTFDTPGLVAMNHPDKDPNGASSEFFCLQSKALPANKRKMLDGEYAPFGFIVGGRDIFETLQPGDVIDNTFVDPFGKLNLMKIRQSSFQDAAKATEAENKDAT